MSAVTSSIFMSSTMASSVLAMVFFSTASSSSSSSSSSPPWAIKANFVNHNESMTRRRKLASHVQITTQLSHYPWQTQQPLRHMLHSQINDVVATRAQKQELQNIRAAFSRLFPNSDSKRSFLLLDRLELSSLMTLPKTLERILGTGGGWEQANLPASAGARDDAANDASSMMTSPIPTAAVVTSDKLLTLEAPGRLVTTSYLCVLLLLSLLSNGTLGLVFQGKKQQLLTVSNYFVLNLACCQLGLSLLVLPVSVTSVVHGKWVLSDTWCRSQSYLLVVLVVALHYTLLAISLDRNYAIVNSLRYPYVFTHTLGSRVVAGTWIAGAATGLPPLVGWGRFQFDERQYLCSIDWRADRAYSFLFLGLVFLLPLLVHVGCYFSIFRAALRHARRCAKVFPSPATTTITTSNITTTTTSSARTTITQGADSSSAECLGEDNKPRAPTSRLGSGLITQCKALKTIVLIAAAYFVCWTVFVVLAVLKCYGVHVSASMEMASTALVFSSCIVNPLIYGFMNRVTRFEIWKLWSRTCHRHLCRLPLLSFTGDSEDSPFSSTRTTTFSSSTSRTTPSTLLWVTTSSLQQRTARRNSSGVMSGTRIVEEMVTIREESELAEEGEEEDKEEDKEEESNDDDDDSDRDGVANDSVDVQMTYSRISSRGSEAMNDRYDDDIDVNRMSSHSDERDEAEYRDGRVNVRCVSYERDALNRNTVGENRRFLSKEGDATRRDNGHCANRSFSSKERDDTAGRKDVSSERDIGNQSDTCTSRGFMNKRNSANEGEISDHTSTFYEWDVANKRNTVNRGLALVKETSRLTPSEKCTKSPGDRNIHRKVLKKNCVTSFDCLPSCSTESGHWHALRVIDQCVNSPSRSHQSSHGADSTGHKNFHPQRQSPQRVDRRLLVLNLADLQYHCLLPPVGQRRTNCSGSDH